MYFTDQLEENMTWLNQALHVDKNFDVVYRVLTIADKKACLYFVLEQNKKRTLNQPTEKPCRKSAWRIMTDSG